MLLLYSSYSYSNVLLCVCFTIGPSIKYVHSKERKGVKAKAYVYCFNDVILLFWNGLPKLLRKIAEPTFGYLVSSLKILSK